MAYSTYTQSFGSGFANSVVTITEAGTGLPATILASTNGGLLSNQGQASLDSSGNLSVVIDTARTWNINTFDGVSIQPVIPVSSKLIKTNEVSTIIGEPGVIYSLDTAPFTPYTWNGSALTALSGGGGGGSSNQLDAYIFPAPTGSDDAAFVTALASSKTVWILQSGTYILNSNHPGFTSRTIWGMGRDRTTIKLADGANITSIFTCAVGVSGITIKDLTYDGNYTNQSSGRGNLIDLLTNSPSDVVIDNCKITNTFTSDGIGVIGCTNFRISNNIFTGTNVVALRLDGCSNGIVTNNFFTNWNSTGSQSAIWLLNPGITKNITISNNRFINVRAGVFCIESIRYNSIQGLTLSVAANVGGTQVISGTDASVQTTYTVGRILRIGAGLSSSSLFRELLVIASTATSVTVQVIDGGPDLVVETGTASAGIIISTYHTGITITDNFMDGGGFRGTGVSGFFSNSVIANNVLVNGADITGTNVFWRNGFELFGNNTIIANNSLYNGAIAIASSVVNFYPNSVKNKVVNNSIVIKASVSTNFLAMQLNNQDDLLVSHNDIQITLSGSATLTGGIGVGVYGFSGILNRALITENNVKLIGTAASTGIRNLSSSSTDIDIRGNTITNFLIGIGLQTNSNDVNIRVLLNNVWNNTTPIGGVPAGSGYLNQLNLTQSGQTSLGLPVLLTSAALAALTSGTPGIIYVVTDGAYRGTAYLYDGTSNTFYPLGTSPTIYGFA
jgi:hypothetical protein